MVLMSCNGIGIMDNMYDDPTSDTGGSAEKEGETVSGTIIINASTFANWAYIDFHAIRDSIENGLKPSCTPVYMDIPLTATAPEGSLATVPGSFASGSPATAPESSPTDEQSGVYFRWYDVFGKGLNYNRRATAAEVIAVKRNMPEELKKDVPMFATAPQPEPASWDIAFHYCNVRTNGGGAYQTPLTSTGYATDWTMLGSKADYAKMEFTEDTWNENWVWINRNAMLAGIIACQGIRINETLGTWLEFSLKNLAPLWTHRSNIYILRMKDGTMAALNLVNYKGGPDGSTTGYLTINFLYPLK